MALGPDLSEGDKVKDEVRGEMMTVTSVNDDEVTFDDEVGSETYSSEEVFAGFDAGTLSDPDR